MASLLVLIVEIQSDPSKTLVDTALLGDKDTLFRRDNSFPNFGNGCVSNRRACENWLGC